MVGKIVKPAEVCEHCGAILKPAVTQRFCDLDGKKIPKDVYLSLSVFWIREGDAKHFEFCSWKCVAEFLKAPPFNKRAVRFITLRYINAYQIDFEKDLAEFLSAFKEEERA